MQAVDWARRLMALPGFFVLDCEATGLTSNAEPVSICLVGSRTGKAYINTLVKPTIPMTYEAMEITGINEHKLRGAPAFPDIYASLSYYIGDRVVVAYNTEFDRGILWQACKVHNLPEINPNDQRWTCAMLAYAKFNGTIGYRGDFKWWKLVEAAAHLGIPTENAHDAEADCRMTLELIRRMSQTAIKD